MSFLIVLVMGPYIEENVTMEWCLVVLESLFWRFFEEKRKKSLFGINFMNQRKGENLRQIKLKVQIYGPIKAINMMI